MQYCSYRSFILIVLVLALGIPACYALQMDLSPTQIQEGGQVTIKIQGLNDGSTFAISVQSNVKPSADRSFDFRTSQFTLPFSLQKGSIRVEAQNVKNQPPANTAAGITVSPPGNSGYISLAKKEDGTGSVNIFSSGQEIKSGTYEFISVSGTAKDGATVVPLLFEFKGTKKGAADSQITFNIEGISSGAADVKAYVDGTLALDRQVTVGAAPPTVATRSAEAAIPVFTEPPVTKAKPATTMASITPTQKSGLPAICTVTLIVGALLLARYRK